MKEHAYGNQPCDVCESLCVEEHPGPPELVNHPSHYGGADNPHETIKVLETWLTPEQFSGFLLGNAVKYLSRAGKKRQADAQVDLEKASWYLEREIARLRRIHG